jgi:hypothetical protein
MLSSSRGRRLSQGLSKFLEVVVHSLAFVFLLTIVLSTSEIFFGFAVSGLGSLLVSSSS